MRLWYVPLEALAMRYTSMQDRVTRRAFEDGKLEYVEIKGTVMSSELKTDQFLNPYSTNFYKFSQMMEISKLFNEKRIKDGDVFYFSDAWFPGVEAIKYMSKFQGIDVKIYGILHAGSFTPTDTVNSMKEWARHLERSWISLFDGLFLGSEQTRQDLLKAFTLEYNDLKKLHVTGLAYDSKEVEDYINNKEDIVIFPHRLHPEKQEDLFNKLKSHVKAEFIATHDYNLSKEEYYKLLGKSKVLFSASLQENFGYAVLEGCSLGVTPVLPINNTCYKYMYPREVLYETFEESIKMVKQFLDKPIDLKSIPRDYDYSIDRQVKIIKEEA